MGTTQLSIENWSLSLRVIAAVGAVTFGAAAWFAYHNFIALTMIPAGVTVGFVFYTLFGQMPYSVDRILLETSIADDRIPTILTIVFLLASSVSVVSATWGYYTLPVTYYIAIAVAGTVLFCRIILTDAIRSNVVLVVLYGLNTFGSIHFAFPGGMGGPDHGYHLRLVEHIYEIGYPISGSATYAGFPGQHLSSAIAGQVLGLTPNTAYLFIGLFGMSVGVLLTYAVGIRLFGQQFALIAMLLYASMSYIVFRGTHPTQQAHLLPLTFLLFVAAIYLYSNPDWRNRLFILIAGVALISSHHYNSFVAAFMLASLLLGFLLANHFGSLSDRIFTSQVSQASSDPVEIVKRRGPIAILIFITLYATHMTFTSGYFESLVGYMFSFVQSLFQEPSDPLSATPRFADIPPEQFLLNTLGEGILMMLVVLGGLTAILYQRRVGIAILLWLAVAGALAILGVVVDFPFVIPQRIYVLAQMTAMGFLAAIGLVYLLNSGSDRSSVRRSHLAFVVGIVFLLIFFSTASTVAGFETSLFNEGVTYPIQYTIAEEEQAEAFWAHVGVNESQIYWERGFEASEDRINFSSRDADVIGVNHHRIGTGITVHGGSGIGAVRYVIPESPMADLERERKVYHNGATELYVR